MTKEVVFRFQQFQVQQSAAAFPVTTDACFLGALVNIGNAKVVADFGAGTGVLTLMAAQKSADECHIYAIEAGAEAFAVLKGNLGASPWAARLLAIHARVEEFEKSDDGVDLIIANPPFFKDHLPRPNETMRMAMHYEGSLVDGWLGKAKEILKPDGTAYFMIHAEAGKTFEETALAVGFHIIEKHWLYHRPGGPAKRVVWKMALQPHTLLERRWHIKTPEDDWDADFRGLLKDFYTVFA